MHSLLHHIPNLLALARVKRGVGEDLLPNFLNSLFKAIDATFCELHAWLFRELTIICGVRVPLVQIRERHEIAEKN
jgi:hypothetical protein